jgi:hypothetical protein
MKKVLLPALLFGILQVSIAQDVKKVETNAMLGKWEDAKTEVDKAVTDPKNQGKPDAWYWKSRVYAEMAKEDANRAKYPTLLADADEAFKKYEALDPTLAMVKSKGADGYFAMYAAALKVGTTLFNDKSPGKKWEDAGKNFEKANDYVNTIIKNKWTNNSVVFDTTTVLYAAYAYQNAQMPEKAAQYYSFLADNKVKGEGYDELYKYLALHYVNTKNEPQFAKYITIAKEVYPKDDSWEEFEVLYMDKNLTLDEKTASYDKGDAAGTLSELKYLQFGDIFIKAKNADGMDSAKQQFYTLKAADAFKKAYGKNKQNAIAAFNAGVIYYNQYVDYDDKYAANIREMQRINADKPVEKDPKKKAAAEAAAKAKLDPIRAANVAIEKPLMENLDIALEWLEKSFVVLKDKSTRTGTEKSVINKDVDFLANLYAYKRDKARGKDDKAFDAYDAKYKEFDALHGKF